MFYGHYFSGYGGLAFIVAVVALIISLRTQRRLEQRINTLEWMVNHAVQQATRPQASTQMDTQQHIDQNNPAVTSTDPAIISSIPTNNNTQQANEPGEQQPISWSATQQTSTTSTATHTAWPQADEYQTGNQNISHAKNTALEPDEQSLNIVTSVWHSFEQWFKGGNAIVRIGVIILLVGVVLLLRLANELFNIPIEVRLGAVALGGVGLTLLGLRLRQKRRGYAISIQGAGLAIVYFTLFAAFRLYQVMPASLTFALLAILAVVSAALALLQNALPLALLAFGGGFLAPLLTSTGSNNLVGLFSYYLMLNLALAWVAHYKTWKVLNVLGAVMTFGVAGFVGWNSYDDSMRWSLEALLLAHLALYLFMVVRYSQQLVTSLAAMQHTLASPDLPKKPALTTVDSTLLFGVPLMGFALQAGLLHDIPYALALSSAALSGIYLLLGYQLFYRNKQLMLLTEGVLALGVGFMALVIPLALDAKWTAVGWAVQGTALIWLGQQQQRIWSIRFGVLLLVLTACTIILIAFGTHGIGLPLLVYTVCLFVAALLLRQGVFSQPAYAENSNNLSRQGWKNITRQGWVGSFSLLLAAFVASQFSLIELARWCMAQAYYWPLSRLALGFYPLIFAILSLAAGWRLQWLALQKIHLGILVWLTIYSGLIWLDYSAGYHSSADSSHYYNIEQLWLLALGYIGFGAVKIWHQAQQQPEHQVQSTIPSSIIPSIWVIGILIFSSIVLQLHWSSQPVLAMIIGPLILLLGLLFAKALPLGIQRVALLNTVALPVISALLAWMLFANWWSDGQVLGLVYIPVVNLLDICVIVAGFIVYRLTVFLSEALRPVILGGLGLAAFITLTSIVIRTLHQWAATPSWDAGAWSSDLVQTSLTIVWILCALLLTGLASKQAWRQMWLVGIVLLGIVVAKLLLIDLSNAATIARIVSFIGAGLTMLLIGYIAPLPPVLKDAKNPVEQQKDD